MRPRSSSPSGDPADVAGAGRENLAADIGKTLAFAVVAAYGAVMMYRRTRRRPLITPAPPDHQIAPETSEPVPAHAPGAAREGTTGRGRKAVVALSVAGAATVACRKLAGRHPK